ncbi:MAG: nitronate monooxygenase family protein [SAR324 cluster bacterium]|nr:nitronate monooxygenase family protein [SAR324 cluster bacterium]
MVIHTAFCDLLGVEHPIVLGGMAGGQTSAPLAAAVSEAGGLGGMGITGLSAGQVRESIAAIRAATDKPFLVNFLLFLTAEDAFAAALEEAPPVLSFAWPRRDQELGPYFERAHQAGAKVMFMAGEVDEVQRGAEAGADVIVAQGTEGGGHVGWMASLPLLPMVVDAVNPLPVLAAGGIADGRGLAAALALGAQGVLLGTRFLATEESPLHGNFKAAILESDGHDTLLSEIPDLASGLVWPGGMARARRNVFIERWAGREWELRAQQARAARELAEAREAGDADNATLYMGQDAGLIHDLPPAGEVVRRMVEEAAQLLESGLPGLVRRQ